MTRQNWTIGLVAAAFSVSLAPALWAQDSRGPQGEGSRPSNGATTGSAAPRGGGDGGASAGSSSSAGTAGSSSSAGMGAAGGFSGGMTGYSGARERAPERPGSAYGGDRRGGSGGEMRATPRGGSAASGGEATRGAGGGNTMYYAGETGRDRAPVPAYSRPRDGRPVTGTPDERTWRPGGGSGCVGRECGGYYPIYDPYYYYGYYDPYYFGYGYRYSNYWLPGYGFGFGYFGYDPFLFGGYYDPYTSAYGAGQSSGGYGVGQYKGVGSLRLKVSPKNAQVYIDGYYVGLVDSFDGMFQKLEIEAGSHRVEVKAEGFEPVQFDVMVQPGETVTYKGELPRIK